MINPIFLLCLLFFWPASFPGDHFTQKNKKKERKEHSQTQISISSRGTGHVPWAFPNPTAIIFHLGCCGVPPELQFSSQKAQSHSKFRDFGTSVPNTAQGFLKKWFKTQSRCEEADGSPSSPAEPRSLRASLKEKYHIISITIIASPRSSKRKGRRHTRKLEMTQICAFVFLLGARDTKKKKGEVWFSKLLRAQSSHNFQGIW